MRWVDMWTVNFEFYRSTYGGAMEAENFPQTMRAACAYIDTLTFGRLRGAEEIPDDLRLVLWRTYTPRNKARAGSRCSGRA